MVLLLPASISWGGGKENERKTHIKRVDQLRIDKTERTRDEIKDYLQTFPLCFMWITSMFFFSCLFLIFFLRYEIGKHAV